MSLRVRILCATLAVALITLIVALLATRTMLRIQMRRVVSAPQVTVHDASGRDVAKTWYVAPPPTPPHVVLDRSLLIVFAFATLLAILFGLLVSRRITHPIEQLTRGARQIAAGDLSTRVTVRADAEIAALAATLNTMAASVERNEELRRRLVTDVAHELRTPLTNLRGYLESAQDGLRPPAAVLDSMYADVLLLQSLIDDLQELSLAEAGQLRLELREIALGALARRVAEGFRTRGAEIAVDAEDVVVRADEQRIAQVLSNLLANATRFSDDVTLRVEARDGEARVSVADRGPGIAADDLPHLFDRFYRADRSRSRHTGGAGLGLAIVKQLVEAHGGRVEVESAPGQGATFTFTLPLHNRFTTPA